MKSIKMVKRELNINKSNWTKVKLGELATEISNRVDNPGKSGYERFVGLEHFVSGEIKIRNYGSTKGLVSAGKEFKSGDILFARRNAYLRRASLVEFDGVCSGDAFVLRENHEKILPGFLSFVVNSEKLWDFANSNAAGTMSKRVKWRDLADYEFLLPPRDKQAELAKLLFLMNSLVETKTKIIPKIESVISTIKKYEFESNDLDTISLLNCGSWFSGGTPSRQKAEFWGGEIPWVSPKDMKREFISDSIEKITTVAMRDGARLLPKNAILIVVRGLILAHSFPVGMTTRAVAFNQDMKGLIASSEFEPEYLLSFLQYKKDIVLSMTTTTTHGTKRLASEALYSLFVPRQTLEKQKMFLSELEKSKSALAFAKTSIVCSKELFNSIINQVF